MPPKATPPPSPPPSSSRLYLFAIGGLLLSAYSFYGRFTTEEQVAVSYSLPPPRPLEGALSPNGGLEGAEYLLEGAVVGPESMVVDGDTIYTTTADARILKIKDGVIVKEHRLTREKECGAREREHVCGRPLGLRRLPGGGSRFIVVDAYLGVFEVDFEKDSHKKLLDSHRPVGKSLPRFLNDIDIVNSDEVLLTDSSTLNERRNFMKEILESAPLGRVIHLRLSTGEAKVLVDGLHFPNGIQVLPDGASFLVAELTRARIMRHYLSGRNKGKTEVFVDNLPGLPDNIRLSSNGTIWVGLAGVRREGQFNALEWMADKPKARHALIQMLPSFVLQSLLPHMKPPHALVLQLSLTGKIISTLHDEKGTRVKEVSQVTDSGDFLYLGSFNAPYIARVRK